MAKVLIAGPIQEAGLALLKARPDVDYEQLPQAGVADLEARIADLDGLLLRLTPLSAETIAKATRLKVVARYGVGYDAIDVDALTERGIPLAIVGEANSVPVAEQTLGLMIGVARRIVVMDRKTRSGEYHGRDAAGLVELSAKTVLIVGFGRVGRQVARRCAAFDMTIIVADPYVEQREVERHGYRYVADFREALDQADFVTLHLPGNLDKSPVMTAAEFSRMKPGAFFINVSRGSLVDEAALAAALTGGHLRGAGLDVTRQEPPPKDNPLLGLDQVVFSPHVAGLTEECARRMSEVSVGNVLDGIDGRLKPELVVNKEVLGSSLPPLVGAPMPRSRGGR
ncbi:MAG: hydroxyacid dehydrogenase [Kiloniellales bacterium]